MKVKVTTEGMNTGNVKVLIDDHDITKSLTDIDIKIKEEFEYE